MLTAVLRKRVIAMTFGWTVFMWTAVALAGAGLPATAPPASRGRATWVAPPPSSPAATPDRGRTRTEIIGVFPLPSASASGQTLILRTRPDGTTGVTVCSWVAGVGLLCTGPAQ